MTQDERDRAARLGAIAGKAGRPLGDACPYKANGTPQQKALTVVFVRAYVRAGGTVDGLDYGDGKTTRTRAPRSRAASSAPAAPRRPYGHLGFPAC